MLFWNLSHTYVIKAHVNLRTCVVSPGSLLITCVNKEGTQMNIHVKTEVSSYSGQNRGI